MDGINCCIRELENNIAVFSALLKSADVDFIKWKQEKDKWNLLEITCHLLDEEREDFRYRLKAVLESPGTPWPAIDPAAWVAARDYASKNFHDVFKQFIEERQSSLAWLRDLKNPNWENTYMHPKIGPLSARFIIANWVAHDYLHIRQVTKLKYDYLACLSNQKLDYAGNW